MYTFNQIEGVGTGMAHPQLFVKRDGAHLHAVKSLHDTLSPFDGLFLANVFRPGELGRQTSRIGERKHKILEMELVRLRNQLAKCVKGACLADKFITQGTGVQVCDRTLLHKGNRLLKWYPFKSIVSYDHVGFQLQPCHTDV